MTVASPFSPEFREKYELVSILGEGAFGIVYHARNNFLKADVAVKVLKGQNALDLGRFERESSLLASLDHHGIVRVRDAGLDAGMTPFLVTELVVAPTLERVIATDPPPPERAVAIVAAIGEALAFAHDRGIIHRDVKPANVFVLPGGIKLGDFGLAREISGAAGLTESGMILGTPHYISPEVARGERAGPASDQYALGVIAFELLARRRPFEGEHAVSVIAARLSEEVPSLSLLRPGLPDELCRIVSRALARDPEDRFPKVLQMVESLRSHVGTRPPGSPAATVAVPASSGDTMVASPGSPASHRPSAPPQRVTRKKPMVPVEPAAPRSLSPMVVVIVLALALFGWGASTRTAQQPRGHRSPLTLQPGEDLVMAPKVLFQDDFDRQILGQWEGDVKLWNPDRRRLKRAPGSARITPREWLVVRLSHEQDWTSYDAAVDLRAESRGRAGLLFNVQRNRADLELFLCDLKVGLFYVRHLRLGDKLIWEEQYTVSNGKVPQVDREWHELRVEQRNGAVGLFVDGHRLYEFKSRFTGGLVGLAAEADQEFRSFRVLDRSGDDGAGGVSKLRTTASNFWIRHGKLVSWHRERDRQKKELPFSFRKLSQVANMWDLDHDGACAQLEELYVQAQGVAP
jgi:serine/threonine protein kinase